MKQETKEIIRQICSHWICADEEELERVADELDAKIDEMVESKSQKSAIPNVRQQSELLEAYSDKLCSDLGLDFDNQDEYIHEFLASNCR